MKINDPLFKHAGSRMAAETKRFADATKRGDAAEVAAAMLAISEISDAFAGELCRGAVAQCSYVPPLVRARAARVSRWRESTL